MSIWNEIYAAYGAELMLAALVTAALALLGLLLTLYRLSTLRARYRAAMAGIEGVDLEQWLAEQRATMADQRARLAVLEAQGSRLERSLATRAGHVGVVRFNPFDDSGGDQSFAIAWLDDEASGVVLSSLHSRAGNRVYAKPLTRGTSQYTLSDEEEQAIRKAADGANV